MPRGFILCPAPPSAACLSLLAPALSADEEGSPLYGEDSGGGGRRQFGGHPSGVDRRPAATGPRPAAYAAVAAGGGGSGSGGYGFGLQQLGKRPRQEYETPDLPSHADGQQWMQSQREAFDAVASSSRGSGHSGEGEGREGGAAAGEGATAGESTNRRQRGSASSSGSAARHAAIFALVYGLLDAGEDRRWACPACLLACPFEFSMLVPSPGSCLPLLIFLCPSAFDLPHSAELSTRSTCPGSTTCHRSAWTRSFPPCTATWGCWGAAWDGRLCGG